jgi:hypothetical protein
MFVLTKAVAAVIWVPFCVSDCDNTSVTMLLAINTEECLQTRVSQPFLFVTGRPYFVFRVGHSDVRRERSAHKYLHMSQSLLVVLVIKCVIKLDIRGSVHHSAVPYKKNNKMQQYIKILLFLILNEAQHVSGATPPIIRSLKLLVQF